MQFMLNCPVYDSFRVRQIAGMFDVTVAEKSTQKFSFDDLPVDDPDWKIGLIVGPSGSGKSSVARHVFGDRLYECGNWPVDKAVIDCIDGESVRDVTQLLIAVGFSSPPSWIKPYHVLSNGERFRCDLARALASGFQLQTSVSAANSNPESQTPMVVFDEFTSVVDRNVAIVPVYNATWEFDAKHLEECSRKGELIIDANGTEWHVQKVTTVTHRNIRQCQALAEMTGFLPFDTINIVRPCAAMSQNGPQMTTIWRRVKSNVPAKIAAEDVATHRKNKTKTVEKNFRAYTREHSAVQKNDLVELPDGRQCKIVRVRNSRPMLGWSELFLAINERPVTIVNDSCDKISPQTADVVPFSLASKTV